MNSAKVSRSAETSPVECNGSKAMELQIRLQSQQEELSRMQEEKNHLQEELSSQKVQGGRWAYLYIFWDFGDTDYAMIIWIL